MRALTIAAAVLVAGCAGPAAQVVGSTPGTVVVQAGGGQPLQSVLAAGQAECARYGGTAVQRSAVQSGPALAPVVRFTFECRQ